MCFFRQAGIISPTCYRMSYTSCWALVILFLASPAINHVISPVPPDWKTACSAKSDANIAKFYNTSAGHTNHVKVVRCHVTESSLVPWHLQTLRDHLRNIQGISVFLQVRCSNGGNISLPWPVKVHGLVGIAIINCTLREKYADFGNPEISRIPDQLRVMIIRNSVWLSDESNFHRITSPIGLANLTADYDCGHDSTLEYLVTSNVSGASRSRPVQRETPRTKMPSRGAPNTPFHSILGENMESIAEGTQESFENQYQHINELMELEFDPGEHPLLLPLLSDLTNKNQRRSEFDLQSSNNVKASQKNYTQLLQRLMSLDLQCDYQKLRVLDESHSTLLPVHHFTLMLQGAKYPELRVINYSSSGIRNIPSELQDFRKHFPKLEYLDLSRNYLTEVDLKLPFGVELRNQTLTLDVRKNLIINITLDHIMKWSRVSDVFVDVRDNPIYCGCHLTQLLHRIQSKFFFVGNLRKYSYVKDLICASPLEFKGKKLSTLTLRCGLHIEVTTVRTMPNVVTKLYNSHRAHIASYLVTGGGILFLMSMVVVLASQRTASQIK